MTLTLFEQHLTGLRNDVLDLASRAEQSIRLSMDSLRRRDLGLAREIVEGDYIINHRRFAIEDNAVNLIATQQPMASDLRTIIAVIHIVTEIERIADHAEGIARISLMLDEQSLPQPMTRLAEMAELGIAMMHQSITAFIDRDINLAHDVCMQDDKLDAMYDANYAETLGRMFIDPQDAKILTYQLWTSHNLERIGDRATNICERVVYLVTGRMEEENISTY
ncbi:MAG: phosphate signaling complex protein PhoU [Dehalococcoidia bacterium]